jgi:hypothetical protein
LVHHHQLDLTTRDIVAGSEPRPTPATPWPCRVPRPPRSPWSRVQRPAELASGSRWPLGVTRHVVAVRPLSVLTNLGREVATRGTSPRRDSPSPDLTDSDIGPWREQASDDRERPRGRFSCGRGPRRCTAKTQRGMNCIKFSTTHAQSQTAMRRLSTSDPATSREYQSLRAR